MAAEIVKAQALHIHPDQTLCIGFAMTPEFFVT